MLAFRLFIKIQITPRLKITKARDIPSETESPVLAALAFFVFELCEAVVLEVFVFLSVEV